LAEAISRYGKLLKQKKKLAGLAEAKKVQNTYGVLTGKKYIIRVGQSH
jgi:hypothetical protein